MSSSAVSKSSRRSLPMPLWMQGFVELVFTAALSFLVIALMMAAVWFTNGFENRDILGVVTLSGNIWLLVHGVPLHLDIPPHGAVAGISGTMAYIPLGLTLIPLLLSFRSGRRLARASYEGQFWIPLLSGLLAYALFGVALSLYSSSAETASSPVLSALVPCWVAALGIIGGGLFESRSLSGMIGVNAADSVRKYSQYSRWAGSYVWTLFRASFIAPLALLAGGALLVALSIFYHWNDVLTLYQSLHAGAVGDTAITFLQLGIMPNFMVYAMSFASGSGFALGEGSSIDWSGTDVGALPILPLLGALPQPSLPWSYLVLVFPIGAGLLAGWWFFREGEDHLDEWLSLKVGFRPLSWTLSHLALSLMMGALSGVWVGLLGWAAHGSLGLGKFTDIGPQPLEFGLAAATWFALGIFAGSLFGRLIEADAKVSLDREQDQDVLAPAQPQSRKSRWGSQRSAHQKDKEQKGPSALRLRKRNRSADALERILADEEPLADTNTQPTDPAQKLESAQATAPDQPENTRENTAPAEETPWWEKHTLIREPHKTGSTDGPEGQAETENPAPQAPRLSRGRVIRRPGARNQSTEENPSEK